VNYPPHDRISALEFRDALLRGLRSEPKRIPCKFFYDVEGCRLFREICALPEYYPTRTEFALLREHAEEIAELSGADVEVMEFGAGAGEKIRVLLNALTRPRAYIPVDIAASWMADVVESLATDYPDLPLIPLVCDFAGELSWPVKSRARRVGFFPGSTIGNFEPDEARAFLARTARLLNGGSLLIGVDLVKDPALLHAAYNDRAAVTAAFNLNLLARANREADGNFDLSRFSHYAFYNPVARRIEMYLVSKMRQDVSVCGRRVCFSEGESVLTEYSCKYTVDEFQQLASSAGFVPRAVWCDAARLFSLHWLDAPG
jgi:L-histidine Nalpha-methyltransferase